MHEHHQIGYIARKKGNIMTANRGRKINPYSVTFTGPRTVSEFSTASCRVELRKGQYQNMLWLWLRVTVNRNPGFPLDTVKLQTPAGTVTSLPSGNAHPGIVGSSGTTAAICQGQPTRPITVTYAGAASDERSSKTVQTS